MFRKIAKRSKFLFNLYQLNDETAYRRLPPFYELGIDTAIERAMRKLINQ